MTSNSRAAAIWLGLIVPLALIVVILTADLLEGPKTAYVGVLAVVPMLSAVFAAPRITALVAVITWLAAFSFGQIASDGNVAAQRVRLIIIALVGLAAIGAAVLRSRREQALLAAQQAAAAAAQFRAQAETDQLTGLANRHGLSNRIAAADPTIMRSISIVDCDGLKGVNDRLGHLAGDAYLQAIAGRLVGNLPKDDHIGRWGGDEFIVVQRLTLDDAVSAMMRVQAGVMSSPISIEGESLQPTVSIGVAQWSPGMTFDEALSAADTALYRAKTQGRNQVVAAD